MVGVNVAPPDDVPLTGQPRSPGGCPEFRGTSVARSVCLTGTILSHTTTSRTVWLPLFPLSDDQGRFRRSPLASAGVRWHRTRIPSKPTTKISVREDRGRQMSGYPIDRKKWTVCPIHGVGGGRVVVIGAGWWCRSIGDGLRVAPRVAASTYAASALVAGSGGEGFTPRAELVVVGHGETAHGSTFARPLRACTSSSLRSSSGLGLQPGPSRPGVAGNPRGNPASSAVTSRCMSRWDSFMGRSRPGSAGCARRPRSGACDGSPGSCACGAAGVRRAHREAVVLVDGEHGHGGGVDLDRAD
jgi:hypothetical protein